MAQTEITCPHCNQALLCEEEWAGQTAECPGCGQEVTIEFPEAPGGSQLKLKRHAPSPAEGSSTPSATSGDGGLYGEAPAFYVACERSISGPYAGMVHKPPKEMKKMRRCPTCKGPVYQRVNPGTISWIGLLEVEDIGTGKGLDTWGYSARLVCPKCQEVSCMVEGCEARAEKGIVKQFKIGDDPKMDREIMTTFRNDLLLCSAHQKDVASYQMYRLLGNGLIPLGVVSIALGAAGIWTAGAIGAGIAMFVGGVWATTMRASTAKKRGLSKKRQYAESVKIPRQLSQSKRSKRGPYTDDKFF